MLRAALLGAVACGAISLAGVATAHATPVSGTYNITVWQGYNPNPGSSTDPSQLANTSNTIFNNSNDKIANLTYTATAFTHFSCCLSWALILDDLCSDGERDGGSRRSFGTFW
ncbi:hypothetical protein [Acidiphilium cryptum]|uniref:Uncharacterized protein n=1 Tax=Acidiphilium cryptum (strain JF-5) TaxID=349163 RepID=A5FWE4_ACICJ|nr:hypothetical protein [Acidiphilium cryptum]ABQ29926.1 hypothetical protein Acry_0705 [Acidiphilium cryptum JF-5]